jgi:hypothetical protein
MTDKNTIVGYGYVGVWADGTLGWCLPDHLHSSNSVRRNQRCAPHPEWSNIGEPSYLCKITIQRVPNKRMRRIKP